MKGNARDSGYPIDPIGFYQEPRHAVDALLDAEPFEGPIWDPACGEGTIPKTCEARGFGAYGSDIVDRGYGTVCDFLTLPHSEAFEGSIICNPPFDLIEPFIHKALGFSKRKIAILGRLAFLEGKARRDTLWTVTPFSRVWVFSGRISMPPGGHGIVAKGGSIPFAWYVWDHRHPTGEPARVGFL